MTLKDCQSNGVDNFYLTVLFSAENGYSGMSSYRNGRINVVKKLVVLAGESRKVLMVKVLKRYYTIQGQSHLL